MKDMKMRTRLMGGFGIICVLILILGISSFNLLRRVDADTVTEEVIIVTVTLVTVGFIVLLGRDILQKIQKPMDALSEAAKEIAMGNVDITLNKIRNDEFGDLMDEFQMIIDNIKYQGGISEMIAVGDLTADVKTKGSKDILGNAL